MIIVVGGSKGGTGKTIISTNLSVLRTLSGKKVLLVDGDRQRNSLDWHNQRKELQKDSRLIDTIVLQDDIRSDLKKLKPQYDDIIIDCGGGDNVTQCSALMVADKFIIPFRPRGPDIFTINIVQDLVNQVKKINPSLKSYAFLNNADAIGSDNTKAYEILKEHKEWETILLPIGTRKAFSNAYVDGLGVVELKKQEKKASEEIRLLYKFIYK